MDINPLLYLQAFNNDATTFNTQGHILEQQSDSPYFDTFANAMQAYLDTKQGGNDEEGTIILMDDEDFNDSESLEDFLQMLSEEELMMGSPVTTNLKNMLSSRRITKVNPLKPHKLLLILLSL